MKKKDAAFEKAKELVSKMTIEEAASQLFYQSPPIERLGIPAYNWWNEALHGVARAGTATSFPQAIGMAASFDEDLLFKEAQAIGIEARAKFNEQSRHEDRDIYKGVTMWSPNINIFRDPRWGRGQETYGEDPYLTSRMGCAFVKGLHQFYESSWQFTSSCRNLCCIPATSCSLVRIETWKRNQRRTGISIGIFYACSDLYCGNWPVMA